MICSIVIAGGCFWGVEEYFQRTKGILRTEVAYVNSRLKNPSYEEVCSGRTGAVEAVKLEFNDQLIDLKTILDKYYSIIDPFSLNRQGMDIGSQYRTGLYYETDKIKEKLLIDKRERQSLNKKEIVVEVAPLKSYYVAEEYHQKYLQKNPSGYCHIILPEKI